MMPYDSHIHDLSMRNFGILDVQSFLDKCMSLMNKYINFSVAIVSEHPWKTSKGKKVIHFC